MLEGHDRKRRRFSKESGHWRYAGDTPSSPNGVEGMVRSGSTRTAGPTSPSIVEGTVPVNEQVLSGALLNGTRGLERGVYTTRERSLELDTSKTRDLRCRSAPVFRDADPGRSDEVDGRRVDALFRQRETPVVHKLRSVHGLDLKQGILSPDELSAVTTHISSTTKRQPSGLETLQERYTRILYKRSSDIEVIDQNFRRFSGISLPRSSDPTETALSSQSSLETSDMAGISSNRISAERTMALKSNKQVEVLALDAGSADEGSASSKEPPPHRDPSRSFPVTPLSSQPPPRTPRPTGHRVPAMGQAVPPEISNWFAVSNSKAVRKDDEVPGQTDHGDEYDADSSVLNMSRTVKSGTAIPEAISPWFSLKKDGIKDHEGTKRGQMLIHEKQGTPAARKPATSPGEQSDQAATATDSECGTDSQIIPFTGLITAHSYFAPLAALQSNFNSTVDIVAVTAYSSAIERAKTRPRDFKLHFQISDPSCAPSKIDVRIFRPFKDALPLVGPGDAILLRAFRVVSSDRRIALLSVADSAWAVWKKDGRDVEDGAEVRGPPVEYGEAEQSQALSLIQWWRGISTPV